MTISGLSSVTINGAGTCLVRVKQDETPSHQAPVAQYFNIIINKDNPVITTNSLVGPCGFMDFPLTTSSNSSGSFTHTSSDPSIVSIIGSNTASVKGSGVATIEATLAEDANYNSATATFTITVSKGNSIPTISDETRNYGDADFTLQHQQ